MIRIRAKATFTQKIFGNYPKTDVGVAGVPCKFMLDFSRPAAH
jgi:hypothetical protein